MGRALHVGELDSRTEADAHGLIAVYERERERDVPLDTPSDQLGGILPGLSAVEKEPGVPNQIERADQGASTGHPPEMPTEHALGGDHIAKSTRDTVQLDWPEGGCYFPCDNTF